MNYKQYYERESAKEWSDRFKGTNKRLSSRQESWKDRDIRANFELEITNKANPGGWYFLGGIGLIGVTFFLSSCLLGVIAYFGYIPDTQKADFAFDVLFGVAIIFVTLSMSAFAIVTRRRKR